ncbi:response regulator [Aeromicrobium erythreum]|uniref:LuxR family transcriptional regulator n=1 Tax=Aeromicrobium erythreum TaxID=2041 RepID=A0A0U4BMG5_9ACTN|nr:response regulator transcription factor [Aeromicrobium erythreum]ALX06257.1 LuxR family transcriptional regulator [Aeromicrobium erythreum]
MIAVAVIDDQSLVRDGLCLILDAEPDITVTIEGEHGGKLLDALDRGVEVDVALLDLRMPVMDGIRTLGELSRRAMRPAVLVVTTFDRDELVLDAIAAGADGYLLKRGRRVDLLSAVRTVAAGGSVLAPDVVPAVVRRVRRDPSTTAEDISRLGLTPREHEVLTLVGRGLSNHEVADHLILSPHTVKTHVTNLLAKTQSRDRVQLALLAVRAGLV